MDDAGQQKPPLASGLLAYFPKALREVAKVSLAGERQHHGKQAHLHWDRTKSPNDLDSLTRHLLHHVEGEMRDDDGQLHLAKAAWRSLAALERLLDA